MKKIFRPLLILLLSLTVVMGTSASAWAMMPGLGPGRGPGHGRWFYGGRKNRFSMNFYSNNRDIYYIWNHGNQNFGNRWQTAYQHNGENGNMMPFSDVPAWARNAVGRMYRMGIIKGIGDGLFGSNQSLTRAQFAVLLDREFGLAPSQGGTVTFADVPDNGYYYRYIEAAAPYMDYWNGSNGTYLFHPTDPATREDVIASMVVAAGLSTQTPDTSVLSKFADENTISPNLVNLVAIAVQKGLVTGSQNQSGTWYLYPQQPLTRAEAAMLLYRALDYAKVAPGGITVQPGTSDTISLSAASSTAAVGQPVEITATVLNSSGQVQSNVPVTFSVNGSASVGSGTVDTNPSGAALTTVTDATAQSVTVTASAAGVSNSVTIEFNAATNDSIQLTVSPQSLSVGQTSTVTATVLNSSGQVQSNVPVTFSVNGSASVGSGTVDTNPSGAALTTVTDATAQSVTVTASAAGVSNSATVTFNSATAGSIELTYAPQPAYAGQQETLTATVLNSSNQALADVPVTFSVNGSASVGSGTIDTNPSGAAQTTLNDSTVQSVTVTASAAGLSTSTTIAFNAEVGSIQLTYTPVPAIAGQAVTVSAAVYNSAGQSMANVPVTFGVDGSATIGAGPVDTSSSGIAQTTLNDATAQNVTVTADAPGFNASTVVQFNS